MDHPALTRRVWIQRGAAAFVAMAVCHRARGAIEAPANCPALRRRTIIWQPWASHSAYSAAQWDQMGRLVVQEGYERVLMQWSTYGNVDFWPLEETRWLETGLAQWRDLKLRLIVGLYMGEDYYRMLQRPDAELREHMDDCADECLHVAQRMLIQPPPLPVDGWYLPQEIDDLNWRSRERDRMLQGYLLRMRDALTALSPGAPDLPIYISAFFSGSSSPTRFSRKLERLHRETGVVWVVQGGMGTERMRKSRTASYLKSISDTVPPLGWQGVLEVFDQRQAPDGTAIFPPSTDAAIEQRLAAWCDSTGRYPEMTFSLNQRMDKAAAAR